MNNTILTHQKRPSDQEESVSSAPYSAKEKVSHYTPDPELAQQLHEKTPQTGWQTDRGALRKKPQVQYTFNSSYGQAAREAYLSHKVNFLIRRKFSFYDQYQSWQFPPPCKGPLTTLQCRHLLDVMHPGMRICELRKGGNLIHIVRVDDITPEGNRHRVGQYILAKSPQLSLFDYTPVQQTSKGGVNANQFSSN